MVRSPSFAAAIAALCLLVIGSGAAAQGVTTSQISGVVATPEGRPLESVRVTAIHEPSGTRYEGRTREDGRVVLPNMRVGGPYRVTASSIGFQSDTKEDVFLSLGSSTDLRFTLREAAVALAGVVVTAETDPIFNAQRTGAATAVRREVIATLPAFTGRIEDFARLTPQYSGTGFGFSFAGQDNRLNNVTVDGSYFNNSFGLAGQPGDRTGVAPISMDAIEQIQIAIAPYDVRQGNFVGANVNSVTRSGTNQPRGSIFRKWRHEGLTGEKAGDLTFNRGTFDFRNFGGWVSGPIIRDRMFFFFSYEDEETSLPGTTFRANTGGENVAGGTTRVLASDLQALRDYLTTNFNYDPGGWENYPFLTPGKRLLAKVDVNLSTRNKFSLRYNRLDSNTDVLLSNSSSLGFGSRRSSLFGLNFVGSNYKILENIRSIVAELNSTIGDNMANNFIVGYTEQDESRGDVGQLFPLVDILETGTVYTSFGSEPFTPNNELRYKSVQLQNNFSIFGPTHNLTFGVSTERYESENVFFPGKQSVYVYNSLADFYTDANDYLANPNRTVSPVTLNRFQVRWMNIPGAEKPVQPLEVWYSGIYGQDEWNITDRLKLTAGLRLDRPTFGKTGFANANADALTFRDETGNTARYSTAKLPDANILWSPRLGFNWDVQGNRTTQVRGGTGVFTGRPAYVWISNQIGTTGVLTGFESITNRTDRPFHPDPDHYKPATVTGAPASSYELALTDPGFKFPQLWRTDVGIDQRLFGDWVGTLELLYNRDVNGVYYINANLPPPNRYFVGADDRPRWVGTNSNRIHVPVQNAIVLKNQNEGYSWNIAGSLEKSFSAGFFAKGAYSYGVAKNTVDPGSIAFGSWASNPHPGDPNNPGLAYAATSPGHRFFAAGSYRTEYFRFGATTLSLFWESRTLGNASYVFSGDLNGDGSSNNDLLYVPRDMSEMSFQQYTQAASGTIPARTFTAAEQAAAWEVFIQQDDYLSSHRGQYLQRNAIFLPIVHRADFSIAQELFATTLRQRNGLQFRVDILNVGNLLNKNWGVGQRLVTTSPLLIGSPVADPTGRMLYRLRNVVKEGEFRLIDTSLEPTAGATDVYRVQLGLRYTFN
jgi:outer membrane receptor protein involved in Fe transport